MFDSDSGSTPANKKLPKAVMMMVEKGNLVQAIKTLAADENISMDAAKSRIDAYELALKNKQQQTLTTIANKQGIPSQAFSFDREQVQEKPEQLIRSKVKSTPSEQGFQSLQDGVDSQLNDLGYKKPLIPYWAKRLLVIAAVMAGLFWIMWRIFG